MGWRDSGPKKTIPDWFWDAIDVPSIEHTVEVEECDVTWRCWGDAGKPALLFIHGMCAHSRWWDFIAPQLIDDYYCVAMDLTGMGDSDFRYEYHGETYVQEVAAVCDAAGLDESVTLVAHSFGGLVAVKAVASMPERFGRLILVDSGIRRPGAPVPDRPPMPSGSVAYPDRESGERRFRLYPPQPCENDYVVQYIAKQSLMPVDGGWAWKFDDDLPESLHGMQRTPEEYAAITTPFAVIYGDKSESFDEDNVAYMRELIPGDWSAVAVQDAYHHVFLDQPIAFVEALRKILV